MKPGQELREMTICTRTYSLAYNKNGVYSAFLFHDGIPLRKGCDETKNEWSFFRKSKQGLNAKEWRHVCHILVIKIYFLICFDLSVNCTRRPTLTQKEKQAGAELWQAQVKLS